MTDPTIQIDPTLNVPYLDQWLGTWFIEPERGRALHSAIRQLNIGVHLQHQASVSGQESYRAPMVYRKEIDARAQNPDGQPVAIDWEQAPRSRGAYGYRSMDGVAVLELNGSLMKQEASATESTSTVMMRRTVRKLMTDGQVRAVIFQIDSPGGTVSGIYELASDIAALARIKPVHAHASNICASAAYLLACQMRSISSTASSLVGSLGTFGVVYDVSEMAAREGVKVHLLKGRINGKDALMKGVGTPGTAISAEQLARMQEGVDDLNQQFYDAVLAGPRKPKAAAVEGWFADAGVWVAAKARTMGLIDRVESFDDMLARVSGEARNGARDTTPSTGNKPGDDGTNTGRRADAGGASSIVLSNGAHVMTFSAGSPAEVAELMSLHTKLQAGGTSAGELLADVPGETPAVAEAESPPRQEADMSQQQTPGATAPATTPAPAASAQPAAVAAPAPATIAELRAAFPGDANATFVLAAAENAWTIGEAKSTFAVVQSQVAARTPQAAPPATAPAPQAEQPAKPKPGVPALASAPAEKSGAAGEASAVAQFESRVKVLVDGGMTRQKAAQKVLSDDDTLRADYNREKAGK